jgi:hypothetical protein
MATGSRTLKLSILGDVSDLNKSLKTANTDVQGFGDKLDNFSKRAGQAFAIAGAAALAYAGKLAIDGVKSAIEDEAAQAKLAKTLENVTGATDAQIKATEDYITKTSLANGITDDVLRPSLDRLVRSTQNVEEAQKLQTLALDISAGSGKSLETVTEALAKATDGNTGALGRLGVGLDKSEIKTMSMNEITKKLSETFAGQASTNADTFQGKMDRVKVALDEAKESVGAALLPILEKLADFIAVTVVPQINGFIAGLTGKESLNESLTKTQATAVKWGQRIKAVMKFVVDFKDQIIILAGVLATVFVVSAIAGWVSATVAGIKTLIVAYNLLKTSAIVAGVASAFALNPLLGVGAAALAAGVLSAGIAIANRYNTSAPGASDLTGMESTGLSAGLYGSTPVNGGPSAKAGGATSGTTGLSSSAPSGSATAIASSNDKALANIDKLQKDVDKNLAAANKALEVANAASAKADAFFPISAGDLSYQDSFRNNPMNNTYITVNGALNSEQTARQLISILNDSQARGTQGASNLITTPGGMGF